MKIAVIYEDGGVYVEFPPGVFRELLKEYLAKNNNDVDKAMEAIVIDLKKQTLYK